LTVSNAWKITFLLNSVVSSYMGMVYLGTGSLRSEILKLSTCMVTKDPKWLLLLSIDTFSGCPMSVLVQESPKGF
jgi:hypothetical protein